MVIFVKIDFSKGFYAAALIAYTIQLLLLSFDYVVNGNEFISFFVDNWAGVLGYLLLGALFILRSKFGMDFILNVIGMLLWIVEFYQVFSMNFSEPVGAFAMCSSGILGVILSAFGLGYEVRIEKMKNKKDSVENENTDN